VASRACSQLYASERVKVFGRWDSVVSSLSPADASLFRVTMTSAFGV